MISTKQMQNFFFYNLVTLVTFYSIRLRYRMEIDIFWEGLRMRILGFGNGSWKREFLPGVETLRDTSTTHTYYAFLVFFIFFSDARKYNETTQIGSYVFNILFVLLSPR